ncbi:MAG: polyprenyl synthetase family protein [Candidatus Puniceispirillaceae bacterium]
MVDFTNDMTALAQQTKSENIVPPQADKDDSRHHISRFITTQLPSPSHPLGAPAEHHFARPGKMLRARLALSAAKRMGADMEAALHWAAAVELLHNASLVHDDMCDDDATRRGRPSVWSIYGRNTALALGDWLIARSFDCAAKAASLGGAPVLVSLLAEHMLATTKGQALEFVQKDYPAWDAYLEICTGKTAPLFVAPVEGIAHLAGRKDVIPALMRFFTAVGAAYQIANDIQNVTGTDGAFKPASDLVRRTPNAVIVTYRSLLTGELLEGFSHWLASDDEDKARQWHQAILSSGALTLTAEHMMGIVEEAERLIDDLPEDCAQIVTPIHAQLVKATRQCAL